MLLMVKAYLLGTEESVKEVRKFQLEVHFSVTNEIIRKVESLFELCDFKMYYKDEEGDMVRFSTDDELKFGLDCMKDNIFRLYIRDTTQP